MSRRIIWAALATSVALLAFKEANTNGKYDLVIKNGAQFLKSLQSACRSSEHRSR